MMVYLAALLVAGSTYFTIAAIRSKIAGQNMTAIERQNALMEADKAAEERKSFSQRLNGRLGAAGWVGDTTLLAVGAAAIWLVSVALLIGFGITPVLAAVVAAGGIVGGGYLAAERSAARRQAAFQRQLLEALNLIIPKIEGGTGPDAALKQVLVAVGAPFSEEIGRALAAAEVNKDQIGELERVAGRYPSRAFSMFITALRVQATQGGALAPLLRKTTTILTKDFELRAEAAAEISQTKMEFWAITGIISGIATMMIFTPGNREAYMSPVGIIATGVALANMGLGVFLCMRLIGSVKRGI